MNFSLKNLKNLYEKYAISKIYEDEIIVTKNGFEKTEFEDKNFIDYIKFSYAWVCANTYNYLKKFEDIGKIENYEMAFDEDSEYLYDLIMEYSQEILEVTGEMIEKEYLINYMLEDNDTDKDIVKIIEILYSNDIFYDSFENWIRNANNKDI